jgi:hypothetical protein
MEPVIGEGLLRGYARDDPREYTTECQGSPMSPPSPAGTYRWTRGGAGVVGFASAGEEDRSDGRPSDSIDPHGHVLAMAAG